MKLARLAFEAVYGTLAMLGLLWLVDLAVTREPTLPVNFICPPCPTTADNAKLREAWNSCDQRAKTWEQRARGVK